MTPVRCIRELTLATRMQTSRQGGRQKIIYLTIEYNDFIWECSSGWLLLIWSTISLGFNGAETNCRIAHILKSY